MGQKLYAKLAKKIVRGMTKYNVWNNKFYLSFYKFISKNKNNNFVSKTILFMQKLNEAYELEIFKKILKPGMNVVDIGANFGLYSIMASRLVTEEGHVFSFEPEPSTYKVLENKLSRLDLKNVSLYNQALSNKEGTEKLYFDEGNVGGHSFSEKNIYKGNNYHEVSTNTLDNFFEDTKVDLIKIDTQGAEGLVFSGGLKILKRDKPIILLEFWPHGMDEFDIKFDDLLDILDEIGYKISVIDKTSKTIEKVDRKTLYELCDHDRNSLDFADVILEVE